MARGQILFDAPEVVIPFMVPDGAHSYPDAARTAAEHTMFTVAAGAAVQVAAALVLTERATLWAELPAASTEATVKEYVVLAVRPVMAVEVPVYSSIEP